MAFATEALLQEATAQLMAFKKPKAIAQELGVSVTDIYNLNHDLKKQGKIKGKQKQIKNAGPKKNNKKSRIIANDEFEQALTAEIKRIEDEIERLNKLMNVQDKVSPSFAVKLEEKIQRTTATLAQLQELQN